VPPATAHSTLLCFRAIAKAATVAPTWAANIA
jgi:hypothetical protein